MGQADLGPSAHSAQWALLRVGLVALAIAFASGCALDEEQTGGAIDSGEAPAGPSYADVLADAIEFAPARQQPAFEDGVVTFAEYQSAVFSAMDCLREEGVEIVSGPTLNAGGRYDYEIRGDLNDDERDTEIVNSVFMCLDEHLSFVESVHLYKPPLTDAEELQRLDGFVDCAAEVTGLDYTDIEQPGQVLEQTHDAGLETRQLRSCLARLDYG
ncbi:MAG: hypothetical protein AAGD35_07695 [Actinomycetota bacterium]